MDFLFQSEFAQTLLSTEAQVSLTEKLIIVAVVWRTMGRSVNKKIENVYTMFRTHLTEIEKKFDNAVNEMKVIRETVQVDLRINSERLARVEESQKHMIEDFDKLKTSIKKQE